MAAPLDLNDPIAVLLTVVDTLRAAGIDCAAYGGLALAAYGEPRETKDADLATVGVSGAAARAALESSGLDAVVTFENVTFGGQLVTRITLLPGAAAQGLNTVDFVEPRSTRYARDALARSIEGRLRGRAIRVVAPEDFVLFKALSTRERDLEDAATVLRALQGRLDSALIEREAKALAVDITDHDFAGRLARAESFSRASSP